MFFYTPERETKSFKNLSLSLIQSELGIKFTETPFIFNRKQEQEPLKIILPRGSVTLGCYA